MNVEQNDAGYEQPKKSGKGWFACGGVGCILILLLCGGGIGAGFFFFVSPMLQAIEEAKVRASENQEVIDALGEPLEFGAPQQSQNNQAGGVTIPISGSKNNGALNATLTMPEFGKWETTGLTVEVEDGETIDLSGSSGFSLEIDDGDSSAEEDIE